MTRAFGSVGVGSESFFFHKVTTSQAVGTHYCLAVGNDEGLELDETGEDEELCEVDEEEAEEYEDEDLRGIQSGGGRQENSLRDYSLNSRGLIYKYRVVCA